MGLSREKIYYHSLATETEGSFARLSAFKKHFKDWASAWTSIPKHNLDPDEEFEKLSRKGISLFLREEETFPALLREIPHPPHAIYCLGKLPSREKLWLAIVGTRKATESGKELGREFAGFLGTRAVIVSGLAFGMDKSAHEGCLEAGGQTVAVLGNGLNEVYPKAHAELAKKILAKGGALISEYPPSSPPLPFRFLERNRIVSGLTRGTIVIEAPKASGSLVTARFALDQNREVFVLPGPAKHPNYAGSHELIRSGATLVSRPEEVLEAFGEISGTINNIPYALASFEERVIVEALGKEGGPLGVDELAEKTSLSPSVINQTLSFLLIKSIIKENGSGYSV